MKNVNNFGVIEVILNAAVANNGTVTVGYPTGTAQANYNAGLNDSGSYVVINGNDKYTVAASQITVSYGASNITLTNTTGASWNAGDRIRCMFEQKDGNDVTILAFKMNLASITGTQDVVTGFRPGVDGVIEDLSFVTDVPATTAAKLASLNAAIGSTDVTGGVVALTTAGVNTMGKIVQGTDITGANAITRAQALSIKATSVTAFVEGSGTLFVRIRRTFPNAY